MTREWGHLLEPSKGEVQDRMWWEHWAEQDARQNRPMAQTNKEKQEAFRARQAILGRKEVRGIYLPESLHQDLKDYAAKLLAQHEQEDKK